jgi:Tfp pilus assembly protein PilX
MRLINKTRLSSEKGFALITAIMACAILFALAMLILQLSTSDLQVSSKNVGDKKASGAAETGIHRMVQSFNPQNLAASAVTSVQVDPANDPASVYTISTPTLPTFGPAFLPMTGYAIGGGQSWGQRRYAVNVMGRNTSYNTQVTINTGVGFGPIETSTMSR